MKHFLDEKIEIFKKIVRKYHKTLDLMSNEGLLALDEKVSDALVYAEVVTQKEERDRGELTILDVGSGVGLPALVMAIALPDYKIILSERRKRRVSFLQIALSQLELDNATLYSGDVSELEIKGVNYVSAQAVGSFFDLYRLTQQTHAKNITLLSRKGSSWKEELTELETKLATPVTCLSPKKLSSHGSLVVLELPGGISCLP